MTSFSNTLDTGERVGIPQEGRVVTEKWGRGSAEAEEQRACSKSTGGKIERKQTGGPAFYSAKQE